MMLSEIRRNDYPNEYLAECSSALCLFGAGFYGSNDVIHMYDAGIPHVTVVDLDGKKLDAMEETYPPHYNFYQEDVFSYINILKGPTWDIVSVDPPVALFDECQKKLPYIMQLANKYVALTCYDDHLNTSAFDDYDVVNKVIRSYSALTIVALLAKPS